MYSTTPSLVYSSIVARQQTEEGILAIRQITRYLCYDYCPASMFISSWTMIRPASLPALHWHHVYFILRNDQTGHPVPVSSITLRLGVVESGLSVTWEWVGKGKATQTHFNTLSQSGYRVSLITGPPQILKVQHSFIDFNTSEILSQLTFYWRQFRGGTFKDTL